MGIGWLLTALAIGFIFVILQNKRQLQQSFYKDLNLTQIENELFKILDDILYHVSSTSDFSNTDFENFEAFDEEIAKYKAGIIDNNPMRMEFLNDEFSASGRFKIISDTNGWTKEFAVINKRFAALYHAYINY
ncbi:hypothetical protein [Psychroserpens algicola]|uniref:DUF4760 domain-containing protein n=1 Tax=Psychroserpens algicola TaxID=1719034 RepID=A0ABT0H5C5_9FLAO|nr:hypothetical protein [Psychroserpens algicola]MCK8479582.1 hypothetical protein [Psychroserpens algicola]